MLRRLWPKSEMTSRAQTKRRLFRKSCYWAFAVLCLLSKAVTAQGQTPVGADSIPTQYRPTVGEVHPDFVFPNIETGKPVRLSDFRGKKVLLLHFASW